MSVAKDLGSFLASGGEKTIGAIVYWSLAGVDVPRAAIREELEKHGLGAAMPRDPRPQTSLGVALQAAKGGFSDVLVRRAAARDYAVVLEARESDDMTRLRHSHVATVGIKAEKVHWKVTAKPHQLERLKAFGTAVELEYRNDQERLNTSGLSVILTGAMAGATKDPLLAGVSLRDRTGGVYFVHAAKLELLEKLRKIVEFFCPLCSITVMTITGSADNLSAAAEAARVSFATQLQELRSEVAEFAASEKVATGRNLEIRAKRFSQLKDRVELFRDVLGGLSTDLLREITDSQRSLEKDLGL